MFSNGTTNQQSAGNFDIPSKRPSNSSVGNDRCMITIAQAISVFGREALLAAIISCFASSYQTPGIAHKVTRKPSRPISICAYSPIY